MTARFTGFVALLCVLVAACVLSAVPASAQRLRLPQLFEPPPPPPPVIPPVAEKITRDPTDGVVRGTVIFVHAGGWAGHDANAQQILFEFPGDIFLARGWRVVSLDYDQGSAGLDDVLATVGEELTRGSSTGPVCLYGESSGGHLALVAAGRMRAIDCVIALGAPTDLPLYISDAEASDNGQVKVLGSRITSFFGASPESLASWSPLTAAPTMRADVLLIDEADDPYVSLGHSQRFEAARPTTQAIVLEAGDPADPSTEFVHGHVTPAGRVAYAASIGSLLDRMVEANQAERDADALDCPRTNRTLEEVPVATLKSSLRCLAQRDGLIRRTALASWRRTNVRLRGEINSARVWDALRGSVSGRRALAALAKRRAALSVVPADRSTVTLRLTR